jgi:hypothetical protein
MGSGGIALPILNLDTRWMSLVSFTPRSHYSHGKTPQYPLDRRLSRPQSRSGRGGEERNLCPCRESNPDRPSRGLTNSTKMQCQKYFDDENITFRITCVDDFAKLCGKYRPIMFCYRIFQNTHRDCNTLLRQRFPPAHLTD